MLKLECRQELLGEGCAVGAVRQQPGDLRGGDLRATCSAIVGDEGEGLGDDAMRPFLLIKGWEPIVAPTQFPLVFQWTVRMRWSGWNRGHPSSSMPAGTPAKRAMTGSQL